MTNRVEQYKKDIIFISDLKGTLVDEFTGEYQEEEFYDFLYELDSLSELVGANIHLHLVSPIEKKTFSRILNKISESIQKYNSVKDNNNNNIQLAGAATLKEEDNVFESNYFLSKNQKDNRIAEYPSIPNKFDFGDNMKVRYVQDLIKDNHQALFYLYAGNGKNDLNAMQEVLRTKRGTTRVPNNTSHKLKSNATFVARKNGLPGITECVKDIYERLLTLDSIHQTSTLGIEDEENYIF